MTDPRITRRAAIAAAWSLPVIALAIAAPAASASDDDTETCASSSSAVAYVTKSSTEVRIYTKTAAQGGGNAIDCTLRWKNGAPEYHCNYVTQGKNPGDNQILYTPGDVIVIPVSSKPDEFVQVIDCHIENFS